jgi:TolA-binding protein
MKQLTKKWAAWALLGGAALLSAPALADQLADMATRLSNLRAEVETLSSELAAETTDGRDQLRSLSRQKSELELEIKKEQTRTAKIRQAINERRRDVQAAKKRRWRDGSAL